MTILGSNLSIPNVAIMGEGTAAPVKGVRLFADTGLPFMVITDTSMALDGVHSVTRAGGVAGNRTFDLDIQNGGANSRPNLRGTETSLGLDVRNVGDGTPQGVGMFWDDKEAGYVSKKRGALDTGEGFDWLDVGAAAEEAAERILVGARDGGAAQTGTGALRHVVIAGNYNQDQMRRARDTFNGYAVADKEN